MKAREFRIQAKDEFIRINTTIPDVCKQGGWKGGDTLIQKDLANTLKEFRDKGMKGFYEGRKLQNLLKRK